MAEKDALGGAKFGGGLWLNDFPAKIRVLTVDPMVYNDKFANTRYAFVVFNKDERKVQILDKTGGFASRFQEIHLDDDYGNNIRGIDVKITTNGKQGKDIRYTITPVGSPAELSEAEKKIIKEAKIDLEAIIKKKAPGAIRLSDVNAGKKPAPALGEDEEEELQPSETKKADDVVIEDLDGEPINIDDIPF